PQEVDLIPFEPGFPPGQRWLFFAPHADDEVMGPGATLVLGRRSGVTVQIVVVTDGGAQGDAQVREAEARASASILGLGEPEFWRHADRSLSPGDRRLRTAIAACLERFRPDVVWVPSPVEMHPDHRALALAVRAVVRRMTCWGLRRVGPAWLAAYEVGTPLLPNLLVAVDEGWEVKRRAMSAYASQLTFRPYDEIMEALGSFRSLTLPSCRRAEALCLLPVRKVVRWSARAWAACMGSPRGVARHY
ncbi:MAG: PIG-L deacetylase family protein, partial [Acidobacteriota bacterium]